MGVLDPVSAEFKSIQHPVSTWLLTPNGLFAIPSFTKSKFLSNQSGPQHSDNSRWCRVFWADRRQNHRVAVRNSTWSLLIFNRMDLIGGGLIRSAGGWAAVKAMRKAKMFQKSDACILGDGDFVEQMLSATRQQMERKYTLMAQGYDLDKIAERISSLMNLEPSEIRAEGKEPR